MELVTCPSCGGANHPARTTCGRCLQPLSVAPVAPPATEPTDQATELLQELPTTVQVARPQVEPTAGQESSGSAAGDPEPRPAAGDTQPLEPVDAPLPETSAEPEAAGGRPSSTGAGAGRRGERAATEERPRRGMAVIAVGAIVGAIVGLAASMSLGPFATSPSPPSFDGNVYRRDPVVITAANIGATSTLPARGDNNYEAALMVDGDATTAWHSLGESRPDGVGERIEVVLADPAWVTALRIANGDQRNDQRFLANASLARVVARFDDGSQVVLVFLDQPGEQEVSLPQPVLTSTIVLEVIEAHPGDTSQDLAVSELAVIGHVALGADRDWQLEQVAE